MKAVEGAELPWVTRGQPLFSPLASLSLTHGTGKAVCSRSLSILVALLAFPSLSLCLPYYALPICPFTWVSPFECVFWSLLLVFGHSPRWVLFPPLLPFCMVIVKCVYSNGKPGKMVVFGWPFELAVHGEMASYPVHQCDPITSCIYSHCPNSYSHDL